MIPFRGMHGLSAWMASEFFAMDYPIPPFGCIVDINGGLEKWEFMPRRGWKKV